MSDDDFTPLVIRMLFVIEDPGQGIRENRQPFSKETLCFSRFALAFFGFHSN